MANLTETAFYARIGVKYGAIIIAALMVGRIVIGGAIAYWKATHPAPPPPPTVGFGILPDIKFPQQETSSLTYILETPTGKLPQFTDRLEVYFMPVERPNLLALERAKEQAANLEFVGLPTKISETTYRWNNLAPLPSSLEIAIFNGRFTLSTTWNNDPAFLLEKKLPSEPEAVEEARRFLRQAKLLGPDMENGEASITYLKSGGGELLKTVSLSEADFLQVDLFRQSIVNLYPVVTPDVERGTVRLTFSGNTKVPVTAIDYNYFPVDYLSVHTYPLKTAQVAWQELQAGGGYIASKGKNSGNVTVRRVELGYFDSLEPQPYMQPVYIFKGDNNFVAYVSAVRPPSVTKK